MVKQAIGFCLVMHGLWACNVESTGGSTGGVDDGENEATAGDAGSEDDASALACPAGISVVLSDFASTQVALGNLSGETLSESFVSTGSTATDGLAFPLSGDVALPGAAPPSKRVVVIDRYGTNVITWLDPATAEVLAQLPVGTGFEANPQDYVEIGEGLALVSRLGFNTSPGAEDFDRGSDVLVIDTDEPAIIDSIEPPMAGDYPPGPSGLLLFGDRVLVNFERYAADFSSTGEAMWASISLEDRELTWVEPLPGMKDCGRPALSPDGTRLAVACTGRIEWDGTIEDIAQSAILIFDPSEDPPVEVERFTATELVGEPLQDGVAFASDGVLLFKTQTPYGGTTNNRWFSLALDAGDVTELLEARPDPDLGGKGIVFGSTACAPGCSKICLMTDSDRGVLQRLRVDGDEVTLLAPLRVETSVGLPPIGLSHR